MSSSRDWAPAASPDALRARAAMLRAIRAFFADREVLEVETPLLAARSATEPHLVPFETLFRPAGGGAGLQQRLFLQTSPEFAMKRLLASGLGSIYQICKAFRNEERGRLHNPEFTLLEWYRVGFSLNELIRETESLLRGLLTPSRPTIRSFCCDYRSLFEQEVGTDPINADFPALARAAERLGYPEAAVLCAEARPVWLDFLFSQGVQPKLADWDLVFVTDFPACLPSLARNHPDNPAIVERVEVFIDGIELGNGFHELADPVEQARRFEEDMAARRALGLHEPEKDVRLLAALAAGLPDCSGIAIGLDRLLMGILGASHIEDVLAFPVERA
ncbi:EF-P lysine aminoacylase EpmA [Methylotetracoccus oryzae]|uniref:EF-P lysine aminoacylase EpmA n=1 Tax=Methylotetracoccus oryzae TaxID=1919059 RepID=UPI00111902C6|nr:EF-P lysine aminoacylase EpmA [Methylotetracoccus oryzae]